MPGHPKDTLGFVEICHMENSRGIAVSVNPLPTEPEASKEEHVSGTLLQLIDRDVA